MDRLKMHTQNQANENFRKLAELFPNAVTEAIDPTTGEITRAIDNNLVKPFKQDNKLRKKYNIQ